MSRKKEIKNKTRNNIFAAAFDELKRNHGVLTQHELARMMGVSKDTITNILKYRTNVTEDVITKLQTATNCIFNLQWLRGESDIMLAADLHEAKEEQIPGESKEQNTSDINAIIAAKDETILALKREIAAKEEIIAELHGRVTDKEEIIKEKEKQFKILQHLEKGLPTGLSAYGVAEPETAQHNL